MPHAQDPPPPTYVYAQGRMCTCTMHNAQCTSTTHMHNALAQRTCITHLHNAQCTRTVHMHSAHAQCTRTVHTHSAHAQCTCTVHSAQCTVRLGRPSSRRRSFSRITSHGGMAPQCFFLELWAAFVAQLLLRQLEVDLSLVAVDAVLEVECR